jgi:hypothetical protein
MNNEEITPDITHTPSESSYEDVPLKWRCNKCQEINEVEYSDEIIEIVDDNIIGFGPCRGKSCLSPPNRKITDFLGKKRSKSPTPEKKITFKVIKDEDN